MAPKGMNAMNAAAFVPMMPAVNLTNQVAFSAPQTTASSNTQITQQQQSLPQTNEHQRARTHSNANNHFTKTHHQGQRSHQRFVRA